MKNKSKLSFKEYLALIAGGILLSTSCYFAGKIESLKRRKGLEKEVTTVTKPVIEKRIFLEGYLERQILRSSKKEESQEKKENPKIIILDPGHGINNRKKRIYDPGAISGKYQEAEIVLNQAKIIKRLLEEKGYKVILTRENKKGIYYKDRPSLVKKHKADVYVSLHCNASDSSSAHGQEIFGYRDKKDLELGEEISKEMKKELRENYNYRGTRERSLAVLTRTKGLPSILIESGFITNPNDRAYLTDKKPDVERAIANGIDNFLKHYSKHKK